ncbi:hypothetical protein FJY63_13090, partial [Candidatus Sumerlaeota bacterium]|nr:hypothetical protein [Candidatus Sumerlaeota bacterium]
VEASPLRLARGTRSYPVSDGGNISAANADWYGEIYVQSSVYDAARGFAYWGTDTVPGQVVKVAVSPKGAIHATRVSLTETAAVSAAHFYSHSAGGSVRLGVYSHGEPRTLLWQSGAIANTNAGTWIVLPIASGTPPNLTLSPGTYWLAWQTDSTADVAGRTTGAGGDSFYLNQDFGPFPATIRGTDIVAGSERWSMYLEYVAASAASRWSSLD